jgi:hypothetical protein
MAITNKKLALLHTVAGLTTTFQQLCTELMPNVEIYHIVDESLLKNTIREGAPSPPRTGGSRATCAEPKRLAPMPCWLPVLRWDRVPRRLVP